jgi:uncharacterized membrane protein YbhN (UPF0104 family)
MSIKKNHLILSLKLLLIVAAFILIFQKADTAKIGGYLTAINPIAVILSYLLIVFAQIISALRMQYYFKTEGVNLNTKFSSGLYFVGMFLNTILPGGIGGDGYKVYLIGKLASFPRMKILRILISERASGLLILMLLTFFIAYFSDVKNLILHAPILLILGAIITIPAYFFSIRILLNEQPKTAIGAAPYSLLIQLSGIAIIVTILAGLGLDITQFSNTSGYIVLFLVSSVLSILPISIGGVGIRELSFMYGATLLGLNPELGVAIALIYFVINLLCSLNGLFFWHKLERMYKV